MSLLKTIFPGIRNKFVIQQAGSSLTPELHTLIQRSLIPQSVPYKIEGDKVIIYGYDIALDAQELPDGLEFQNHGDLFLKQTQIVRPTVKFGSLTVMFSPRLTTSVREEQFSNPHLVKLTSQNFVFNKPGSFHVSGRDYKGFPFFRILLPELSTSECKKRQMLFALNGLPTDLFGSIVSYQTVSNKLSWPPSRDKSQCIVDFIKNSEDKVNGFTIGVTDLSTGMAVAFENFEHFNAHCVVIHPGIIRLKY